MTEILTLLIMATQLLTAVQSNPQLPQAFRDNAVEVANYSIKLAQDALKASPATSLPTPQPQPTNQPVFGSIITNQNVMEEDKSGVVLSSSKGAKVDTLNGLPFGSYIIRVSVLDSSGKHIKNAEVTSTIGNKKTDTQSTPDANDWYVGFEFIPKAKGEETISFTSGNKTKSITVNVE